MGHRPCNVTDLQEPDLAKIDTREGVADKGIQPGLVDLDVETPPPPAGTSAV
jgi:hypothetical protein